MTIALIIVLIAVAFLIARWIRNNTRKELPILGTKEVPIEVNAVVDDQEYLVLIYEDPSFLADWAKKEGGYRGIVAIHRIVGKDSLFKAPYVLSEDFLIYNDLWELEMAHDLIQKMKSSLSNKKE